MNVERGAGNLRAMKIFSLLLCCLAFCAGAVRAEIINGRNYVSLAGWARMNGFTGWTRNGGTEFILTNKTSRIVFEKDSADATINGVDVRLSFPVAKGGFVSQLDVDKTIRPLVFPQAAAAKKISIVCLDPGHGGKDPGHGVGWVFPRNEKTYTLALALELRQQLLKAGFGVVMTRDKDVYPELAVRADIANRKSADLFVSLHFNSFTGDPKSVSGPETYCITPVGAASSNDAEGRGLGSRASPGNRVEEKSLLLAYQVQRTLVRNLDATDRGVRRARFEVLRSTEMPAILIEGGYMSHPSEGKKIFSEDYRRQMAAAIVRGILNYQKLITPTATTPPTNTNKSGKKRSGK